MNNEEQLADALARQLDAMLTGEPSGEHPPADIADLLHISEELSGLAPTPRPEFSAALGQSLLAAQSAAGTAGVAVSAKLIITIVLAVITAGAVFVGLILYSRLVTSQLTPVPTAQPTPVETAPASVAPQHGPVSPVATPQAAPTPSSRDADSLPLVEPTAPPATVILDVLPAITVTVEIDATDSIDVPAGLVPDQPRPGGGSNDDDGSDNGRERDGNHHHHDDDD